MTKIVVLLIFNCILITSFAQESMEQVMEKRAKEMHRVIGLTDKEQWKKIRKGKLHTGTY